MLMNGRTSEKSKWKQKIIFHRFRFKIILPNGIRGKSEKIFAQLFLLSRRIYIFPVSIMLLIPQYEFLFAHY